MKVATEIFVIFAAVTASTALQCYFCVGSIAESDCAIGDVNAMIIQECENRTIIPMKLPDGLPRGEGREIIEKCVSLSAIVNGMELYERTCAYHDDLDDICTNVATNVEVLLSCTSCDTDLCNI